MDRASDYYGRRSNDPDVQQTPDTNPVRKHLIILDDIIGFPPQAQGQPVMSNLQRNAIPIVIITPCEPNLNLGMTLFRAEPQNEKYIDMVKKHGYIVKSPISIAFVPDTPVSENITNEYGESFLDRMTDVVSSGFSELNQIVGGRNIIESAKKIEAIGAGGKGIGANVIEYAGKAGGVAAEGMRSFGNQISTGAGDLATKLLAGARIDFPFIWKNSSYSITTSITVRLYNPTPGNDYMHDKYIVGPLVALLSLATPISEHMNVYSFPFIHKIKCAGYFNIDPGTITGISITRGAENQISFGQRPSLVDVRIDFGVLHSVMLNSTDPASASRPSIAQLRNTLLEKREIHDMYMQPPTKTDSSVQIDSEPDENLLLVLKARNTSTPAETEKNIALINRVSDQDLDKFNRLSNTST